MSYLCASKSGCVGGWGSLAALLVALWPPGPIVLLLLLAVVPRLVHAVTVTESALLESCPGHESSFSSSLMNVAMGGSSLVEADGTSRATQLPSKVTFVGADADGGGGDDFASKATSKGTPSLTDDGTGNRRISRSPTDVCTNTVSEVENTMPTNNTPSISALRLSVHAAASPALQYEY